MISTKMFISVDMENSTTFKGEHENWVAAFENFYKSFPDQLEQHIPAPRDGKEPPEFQIWKLLGDEVLMHCDLRAATDIVAALAAVRGAIGWYNEEGLPLKGTCWMGHFPFIDREVKYVGRTGAFESDYIGPSIDCGFRLKQFATPNKVILSGDLTWLLIDQTPESAPMVFMDGMSKLKGIDRSTYPILWLPIGSPQDFYQSLDCSRLTADLEGFLDAGEKASFKTIVPRYVLGSSPPEWATRIDEQVEQEQRDPLDEPFAGQNVLFDDILKMDILKRFFPSTEDGDRGDE